MWLEVQMDVAGGRGGCGWGYGWMWLEVGVDVAGGWGGCG